MDPFRVTRQGDYAFTWLDVVGSTVAGPHNAVLVGGTSPVLSFDDDVPEKTQDAEAYGAPAIVFRPRVPEEVSTPDGTKLVNAEALGARTGDGAVPLAWRDLRWNRAFPNPKPGTTAFVGYGGGFLSMDDTDADCGDQKASIQVLYCPYAFANGVAGKAHSITLNPDTETIDIVHGEGAAILLTATGAIIRSPDGSARIEISNSGINIVGNVTVVGGMVVGVNPLVPLAVGVPVLCGVAPPGVPSVSLMVATP